jgi:peptide-methionine (S)-S-oxide reductase
MNTNKKITLGAGCFWCVEAVYIRLDGVLKVKSGYSGGHIKNPAYREVCQGKTGHAEVCEIEFDSDIVSLEEILEVFWLIHDPTTLNRQGHDIGTHYRSVIFYHDIKQKEIAMHSIRLADSSGKFQNMIVTEISAWTNFYPADIEHDRYYENNKDQPYCKFVVLPKIIAFKNRKNK